MEKPENSHLSKFIDFFSNKKFTEENFTCLILYYMYKSGVETINEDEFSKQLLVYKLAEKYKHLFNDIGLDVHQEKVDLYESIFALKCCGSLWWTSIDKNTLHINIREDSLKFDLAGKEVKDIQLIQEIAHHFGIRNRCEKLGNGKLYIYGFDPNRDYALVDGGRCDRITWQLITDGIIEKNVLTKPNNENLSVWPDPENKNSIWLKLKDQNVRTIKINDATFTIKQGLINGVLKSVELYTRTLDEDYLAELASNSINDFSTNGMLLTDEKPHVYSLKLR